MDNKLLDCTKGINRSFIQETRLIPTASHDEINIVELNSTEVCTISGGFGINELAILTGGIFGALGATFLLVCNGMGSDKYVDSLCFPSTTSKIITLFTLPNLRIATEIFLRVSSFSILFSGAGFLVEYLLDLDQKE